MHGLRHLRRDLVLHREDIGAHFVEADRPDLCTGRRVDQLCRHAQALPRLLHAAFEQVARVEHATDRPRITGLFLQRKRRRARSDLQFPQIRQLVQDRLGNAEGEHVSVLGLADACERQNGDGPRIYFWSRRRRSVAWAAVRLRDR